MRLRMRRSLMAASVQRAVLIIFLGVFLLPVGALAADEPAGPAVPHVVIVSPEVTGRPAALPALYASLTALQVYDGYATLRGVRGGAPETNPLAGALAVHPAAFWTVKAVSTVTTIYFAEQLWRQHRRGEAILTVVVANALMGAIAVRNTQILNSR
jgi:Domain of unknown function (DUF5658)